MRERPRARKDRIVVAPCLVSLAVLAAGLTVAEPASAHTATTAPAAHLSDVRQSDGGPHVVPPQVTNLPVSLVPAKQRAHATPKVASKVAPANGLTLVASTRRQVPDSFSMVGVTWAHGTAPDQIVVDVRARDDGAWGAWTDLAVEPGEGPAAQHASGLRDGTQPSWVGDAQELELRVYSADGTAPRDIQVNAIDPGTSTYDTALVANPTIRKTPSFPALPPVINRHHWGADPSLAEPCWRPKYGNQFKMVFVHHTAGTNHYRESQSAAIVRGIYAYHTQSRGWCDIGYNFLIDKYGNIFEGRRGGIRQPVRGAHAGDYNLNTTGVSLMGNFQTAYATAKMKHALVRLTAWRLGTAYHGGYGHAVVHGKRFKRISGHRDAMSTACPGKHVYAWLPSLRHRVHNRLKDFDSKIERRWRNRLGGPSGQLGHVRVGQRRERGGYHTTFNGGRMYLSTKHPKVMYKGANLRHYVRNGEVQTKLGYPKTNQWDVKGTRGTGILFAHGRMYWSPSTGSKILLDSPVLRRYRHTGFAAGKLGFPRSHVIHTHYGQLARFQHGKIKYYRKSKRTRVIYS
ncbi:MAG: N-acetylmuramoyl-L-alanine amidase [Nocardioidaceae bacterium]